jgi:hypothetical protein
VRRAALVALLVAAGCRGGDDEAVRTTAPAPAPTPPPAARPLGLVPTPPWALRACRASRLLRPICPRRVPAARYRRGGLRLSPVGAAGRRFDFLVLAGTMPPRGVRLVLLASRYGLGRSVGGVFAARRPSRSTRWGRLHGDLFRDRSDTSVPRGRVVFRWQARGVDYAVALHAWEPAREATATLRAVVASTPAAGPQRRRRA